MADINAVTGEKLVDLDFKGKVLVVRKSALAAEWQNKDRRFICQDGFGCSPHKRGRAVFGDFLLDGEHTRLDRSDFEGVAVDQTIPGQSEPPYQGEPGLEKSKGDSIGG